MPPGIGYGPQRAKRNLAFAGGYGDDFIGRLAQMLGGGGVGAQPEDARQAAQMALIAAGLQALGGAGTRPLAENIAGSLGAGMGTFSQVAGEQVQRRQQQRGLDIEERGVAVREKRAKLEKSIWEDDKKRRDEAERTADLLWKNREEMWPQVLSGFQQGKLAEDPYLKSVAGALDYAIRTEDEKMFGLFWGTAFDRIGELSKTPEGQSFIRGDTMMSIDPRSGELLWSRELPPVDEPGSPAVPFENFDKMFGDNYITPGERDPTSGEVLTWKKDIDREYQDWQLRFGKPGQDVTRSDWGRTLEEQGYPKDSIEPILDEIYGGLQSLPGNVVRIGMQRHPLPEPEKPGGAGEEGAGTAAGTAAGAAATAGGYLGGFARDVGGPAAHLGKTIWGGFKHGVEGAAQPLINVLGAGGPEKQTYPPPEPPLATAPERGPDIGAGRRYGLAGPFGGDEEMATAVGGIRELELLREAMLDAVRQAPGAAIDEIMAADARVRNIRLGPMFNYRLVSELPRADLNRLIQLLRPAGEALGPHMGAYIGDAITGGNVTNHPGRKQ